MKLSNETLRDKLAAEYVLGTLSARARRRFEIMLRENPPLRRAVAGWEQRLMPMAGALPPVEPPARVWHAIEARIGRPQAGARKFWDSLSFWRFSSIASAAMALLLLLVVAAPGPQAPPAPETRMVVVMDDLGTSNPAMTVVWEPGGAGDRLMRIRVIGHAEMGPGTAWELWMLPGGDQRPVSLGLITTHETQTVKVPKTLAARLDAADGLAMSVEPAGGSPTGLPSGPVLYAGKCVKV